MLIGSALYTDARKPISLLSLTLQDDVDVVRGIKHILKSHSSLKKLSSEEWAVTKVVLRMCTKEQSYIIIVISPSKAELEQELKQEEELEKEEELGPPSLYMN